MLVIKGFLILDNENREYSAYSGSGELCPARGPNGSFKSLSLAEPGPSPSHITSASQHISPSQSLRIVTTVFSFWLSFPNPPSLPLTLSLSPMCFPFGQHGSTGQGGQGESQAVARSWLRQPDRACSGFQWAMQTCSNMPLSAAACITSQT